MNQEIKKAWLEALRNGKYKQTQYILSSQKGAEQEYCCLGVLCELHRLKHNGVWTHKNSPVLPATPIAPSAIVTDEADVTPYESEGANNSLIKGYRYLGEKGRLPKEVGVWAGLGTFANCVDVTWNKQPYTLAGLNDRKHMSFKGIADVIEKEL